MLTVQKYYKPIVKLTLIALIFIGIYFFMTYLLPFFAPFVAAILISYINEPIVVFMEKRLKISRKIAAFLSLFISIAVLGILLTLGIIKVYNELVILKSNSSVYINSISTQITDYFNKASDYYQHLPYELSNTVNESVLKIAPKIKDIVTSTVTYILNTITSIPNMVVFALVTLLSTYFISSDRAEIICFIQKQLPESWIKSISGIKSDALKAIFGYLKALLILMLITFVEVSAGLFIIGADYALSIGLLVGISEAIPILGTGVIMVPWILWTLISGNVQLALGIGIIYVLGIIIRQVLEPKIIGDQIGLHPLVTLIAMYVGLELLGVVGMIIGPISIIILKNLQDSGVVKIWKS